MDRLRLISIVRRDGFSRAFCSLPSSPGEPVVPDAVAHDEPHAADIGDVLQRIPLDRDHVRVLPRFERADAIAVPDQARRGGRRGRMASIGGMPASTRNSISGGTAP